MNCTRLISKDIDSACSQKTQGFERRAIIINREDIDFANVEFDSTNKNQVLDMPLVNPKKGFLCKQIGSKPFTGSKSDVVVGDYINTVTNTVQFVVLDNTPEVSEKVIDALLTGEFVMVVECKDKGDADKKGSFKIFGLQNGLKIASGTNDHYSAAFGGWIVTLTEEVCESSALYLYDTSYAATKTKFESYLIAPTPL